MLDTTVLAVFVAEKFQILFWFGFIFLCSFSHFGTLMCAGVDTRRDTESQFCEWLFFKSRTVYRGTSEFCSAWEHDANGAAADRELEGRHAIPYPCYPNV